MANTIDTRRLHDGPRNVVVRQTLVGDATPAELTDQVLLDISTFNSDNGVAPVSLVVERIEYDIQGITSVRLEFDATTDDELVNLSAGQGAMDWNASGGIADPKSTGTTGDVVVTTQGLAANATYTLTVWARKKF